MRPFLTLLCVLGFVFLLSLPAIAQPPPSTYTTDFIITNPSTASGVAVFKYSYATRDSESGLWSSESYTTLGEIAAGGSYTLSLTIDADTRYRIYQTGLVEAIGPSFKVSSSEYDRLVTEFSWETYVAPTVTLTASNTRPQLDGSKPIWVTDGSTLDGTLFREGVDKIVGGLLGVGSSGGSGGSGGSSTTTDERLDEIIDNQNRDSVALHYEASGSGVTAASDSLIAAATLQGDNVASALLTHAPTRGDGVTAVAAASNAVSLATFQVWGPFAELTAGFKPLAFDGAFSSFSGFSANFVNYALVVREILLWLTIAVFWFYTRDLLETYMLAHQQTPQITTKAEAMQTHIPGIGWGKQLASVLAIYSAFLLAVGGTIAFMNTGLGNIIPSFTIAGLGSAASHVYSSVSDAAGSDVLPFYERFIPLAAMFECFIAKVVISWAMPMLWSACVALARAFHL